MKKILSLILSILMVVSCVSLGTIVSAEGEYVKTLVDFDNATTTASLSGSGTYEIVDYTTIDPSYTDGKVMKMTIPAKWQSSYIKLPKNWKEGNPIGMNITMIAGTVTTLTKASIGLCKTNSGDPTYTIAALGNAIAGNLTIDEGTSYTMPFDFTSADLSVFEPISTYLAFKTETDNSIIYIDNIEFVYASEDDIPELHTDWEMIYDFEDANNSFVQKVNESGNDSYGGTSAIQSTADNVYEGSYSLKVGKNAWDNSGATHFAKNYIIIPIDAETIASTYDIRFKAKTNGGNYTLYYGIMIDGVAYWSTSSVTGTSWADVDMLYRKYSAYTNASGSFARDESTAFYLDPEMIKNVTGICISTSNHFQMLYGSIDNIEYAVACGHSNYTVLNSFPVSCDEQAYELRKCNDCEKELKIYDESTTAFGHNWVKGNTVDATPAAPGYTEYSCTNGCGQTKQDDFTYAVAQNHRFVAATNQIPDNVDNTIYNVLYTTLPTSEAKYTNKAEVDEKLPYVTDATYSAGVGTFYDTSAGHCLTFGRTSIAVGNYIQFSFELDAGVYNFYTYSRSHQSRATCTVTAFANDESYEIQKGYKQDKGGDTGATLAKNDLGFIVVPEKTTIDVKFTVTNATGGLFFKAFMFDSCTEADIPANATVTRIAPKKLNLDITMKSGASIRLNSKTGIRFHTVVDAEQIAALKAEGKTVTMGTIIAPADYVTDELTHELGEGKIADVKYESETYYEDNNTIVGSIVNIREKNIGREFIGRGYVCVDGVYYYAEMNNNSRSLKYVADALRNDTENAELYNSFKDLVDYWAEAPDWTK